MLDDVKLQAFQKESLKDFYVFRVKSSVLTERISHLVCIEKIGSDVNIQLNSTII